MKKRIYNILVILVISAIFVGIAAYTEGLDEFVKNIRGINKIWLVIMIMTVFLKWFIESVVLHIYTKVKYKEHKLSDSVKTTMVGQFFNAVTPFSTGGQPVQMYVMTKNGISSGDAGSILTVKLMVFQIVMVCCSMLAIMLKYTMFYKIASGFMYLVIGGFMVNVLAILILYASYKYSKITKKIFKVVITFLGKIKLIKDPEKLDLKLEEEIDYFKEHSHMLTDNKKVIWLAGFLTFVQVIVNLSITYSLYRGFGFAGESFMNIITANLFVLMFSSFMPLPGGSGGAEGSFYMLFRTFFTEGKIMAAIFMWRFLVSYMNIIVGGVISALSPSKPIDNVDV